MGRHIIPRGLDLPISGAPAQQISDARSVQRVAVIADDYPLMKPKMWVKEGDEVKRGQTLFEDRKAEGVRFTAPGAGKVVAINRGARRRLLSVVVELSDAEQSGKADAASFQKFEKWKGAKSDPSKYSGDELRALLSESGLWTALRERPFSRVPDLSARCDALFVTAMDSNPLAADAEVVLRGQREDFKRGLQALAKLTEGKIFVCSRPSLELGDLLDGVKRASHETFEGKHPAGLVGTHIHLLSPVSRKRNAWHINYQEVIAVGQLLKSGKLPVQRVISLCGPAVLRPRLLRTRLGAELSEITSGELASGELRIVDGSALYGRDATGAVEGFLGRYHNQVTALHEDRERVFLGWLDPGGRKFSVSRAFLSAIVGGQYGGAPKLKFTTTTNGSHRAMVPIGLFERVMPLDIMPTFLLRSLIVGDLERAEALGCLELDEEDLALCTFVSPGKEDYGPALRQTLETIWKEG